MFSLPTVVSAAGMAAPHHKQPIFVSIVAAGEMLGIGRSRVYQLIDDGRLKAVKLGGRRLVVVESIQTLAASLIEAG